MTQPPEWLPWAPAVVLAAVAAAVLVRAAFEAVRYARAGRRVRPMWRRAWRIRWTWPRTARRVGLVHTERSSPPWWSQTRPGAATTRTVVPAVRVGADRWGVHIDAATVGRVGLVEFQNVARHLADAWRVPVVRVTQPKAGVVRLRALVVDPLTEPLQWTGTDLAGDVATWVADIDQD